MERPRLTGLSASARWSNSGRIAADYLNDATQWYRIGKMNGLSDPWIAGVAMLRLPPQLPSTVQGNGGILESRTDAPPPASIAPSAASAAASAPNNSDEYLCTNDLWNRAGRAAYNRKGTGRSTGWRANPPNWLVKRSWYVERPLRFAAVIAG